MPLSLPVPHTTVAATSYAAFIDNFAARRIPVVFSSPAAFRITPHLPAGLTLAYLRSGQHSVLMCCCCCMCLRVCVTACAVGDRDVIGHKLMHPKHVQVDSTKWARLVEGHATTIAALIDALSATAVASATATATAPEAGTGSLTSSATASGYVHDWSLPQHCPELVQQLIIPKYFAGLGCVVIVASLSL